MNVAKETKTDEFPHELQDIVAKWPDEFIEALEEGLGKKERQAIACQLGQVPLNKSAEFIGVTKERFRSMAVRSLKRISEYIFGKEEQLTEWDWATSMIETTKGDVRYDEWNRTLAKQLIHETGRTLFVRERTQSKRMQVSLWEKTGGIVA